MTLHEHECEARRRAIAQALAEHGGNRTHAAVALGIERTYLLKLMSALGLQQYARGTGRRKERVSA